MALADQLHFQAFMDELDALHGKLVVMSVEAWALDFVGPRLDELPPKNVLAGLVHQDDGAVPTVGFALRDAAVPIPQLAILRVTAFKGYLVEFAKANQLAHPVLAL